MPLARSLLQHKCACGGASGPSGRNPLLKGAIVVIDLFKRPGNVMEPPGHNDAHFPMWVLRGQAR